MTVDDNGILVDADDRGVTSEPAQVMIHQSAVVWCD